MSSQGRLSPNSHALLYICGRYPVAKPDHKLHMASYSVQTMAPGQRAPLLLSVTC